MPVYTQGEFYAVGAEVCVIGAGGNSGIRSRVADCDNHVPYIRDVEGEANAVELARRWNLTPKLAAELRLVRDRLRYLAGAADDLATAEDLLDLAASITIPEED